MTSVEDLAARLGRSPFYRTRLGGVGAIDLASMPLTRREELVRDQLAHLPHGTRRADGSPTPVRLGIAGTGETLLVLAWSAAELARERAAGTRLLRRLGIEPGMRVANTLPGALATPGSLLLGDVVEELGGLDVPLGTVRDGTSARQAWELFDRVRPEVIVLERGGTFLDGAPAAARPWWSGIVWLGGAAAPTPAPPAAGFGGWQRTWLAVPEATSFIAGTCAAGPFHVDERVLAEVVDEPSGRPLPPGRVGTLVLTPLDLDAPLLRYASSVSARALDGPCSCRQGGTVLELP